MCDSSNWAAEVASVVPDYVEMATFEEIILLLLYYKVKFSCRTSRHIGEALKKSAGK